MYLYNDNGGFCVIRQIENTARAIYADVFGGFYDMPLRWAEKAAEFLNNGDYKRGLHMFDLIEANYKRRAA